MDGIFSLAPETQFHLLKAAIHARPRKYGIYSDLAKLLSVGCPPLPPQLLIRDDLTVIFQEDNLVALKSLVAHEQLDIHSPLQTRFGLLALAALLDSIACFRWLLINGLEIAAADVYWIVAGGNGEMIQLACESPVADVVNSRGMAAAGGYWHTDVMAWILDRDPARKSDAIADALVNDIVCSVRFLLEHPAPDPRTVGTYCQVNVYDILRKVTREPPKECIFELATRGCLLVLDELHRRGVDILVAVEDFGDVVLGTTPLLNAAANNHYHLVKFLLGIGADPNEWYPQEFTGEMYDYDYVKNSDHPPIHEEDSDYDGSAFFNEIERRPLHNAVMFGNYEIVELLLKHGADPSLTDQYDRTPATIANMIGRHEIKTLLDSHAIPR